MRQFRTHFLVLREFRLKILHPLELRGFKPAVPRPPLVIRRRTDAVPSTKVIDLQARVRLGQYRDDLGLREPRFFHQNLLAQFARKLYLHPVSNPGMLTKS